MCFCIQKSLWQRLRKSISGLSNHRFSIKPCDISKYDLLFNNYSTIASYLQHRKILTNGLRIGLTDDYQLRLSNDNPSFSISKKISIAQQLEKWLKNRTVLGPFDANYAKRNDITLHMSLDVPKPDGSTRHILNLFDKTVFNHSLNNLIDPKLCSVEHAQTKQVVETGRALKKMPGYRQKI